MPVSPVIGITGAFFNLAWIVAPLCGILIGPYQGFLATLIGTTIYYSIGGFGLPFGYFSLLGPPLSALQGGLLAHKRHKTSLILLGTLFSIWLLLPVGRLAWPVTALYVLGLLFIVFSYDLTKSRTENNGRRMLLYWAMIGYTGNITRHLLGNILGVLIYGLSESIFMIALPSTVVEQLLFSSLLGTLTISIQPIFAKITRYSEL